MDNWLKEYNRLFEKYGRDKKYWYYLLSQDGELEGIRDVLEFIKQFADYDTCIVYPITSWEACISFISKEEGLGLRLPAELFYKIPEYFGIELIEKPQPLVSPPGQKTREYYLTQLKRCQYGQKFQEAVDFLLGKLEI